MAFDPLHYRFTQAAIGSPEESAASNTTDSWSMVSLLKGILAKLSGTISVSVPAGISTSAKQDDAIAALGNILAKLNSSVAVTGTFWQTTQQVSLASVPSHPVTNAGTFAVQPTSSAGTLVATTVTTGGTAANLFGATPANGFEIVNPHATETLYIRENGTATVADNSTSIPIGPKGSYTTPPGYKPSGDVSFIATTTGHAVIGRRW